MILRLLSGQEFGKLWIEHTEFVAPRITQNPEVEAAFLLVIPWRRPECFEPLDLSFDIIGLSIKVHALFRSLFVVGPLEEDSYVGIRQVFTAATSRRSSPLTGSRCGYRRRSPARCPTSPPPASTPCPACTGLPPPACPPSPTRLRRRGHRHSHPGQAPADGRDLDIGTRNRNAMLRSLRCLGERGLALRPALAHPPAHHRQPQQDRRHRPRRAHPCPFRARLYQLKIAEITSMSLPSPNITTKRKSRPFHLERIPDATTGWGRYAAGTAPMSQIPVVTALGNVCEMNG